jgi:hypothetical protein
MHIGPQQLNGIAVVIIMCAYNVRRVTFRRGSSVHVQQISLLYNTTRTYTHHMYTCYYGRGIIYYYFFRYFNFNFFLFESLVLLLLFFFSRPASPPQTM